MVTRLTAPPGYARSKPSGTSNGVITVQTLVFTLGLTSVLLLLGIVGTIVGITRLAYPSNDRYRQPKRVETGIRRRRKLTEEGHNRGD